MKFNRNIGTKPIFRLGVSFRVTQKPGFSLIPEVQNTQAWAIKSYSVSGPLQSLNDIGEMKSFFRI
ncbi:MAG TPA: hypothetical protein DCR95_07735 [Desulfobacter sp.]|nr:hypothetical protein [Desulfobacter sp.]